MPMDWTPPPRGTGREPDLNKVISDIRDKMPSFKKAKGLWVVVLIVAAIVLGSTSYYTVGPEENGIILRFGRFVRESGPGLHFKLPLGIEQAIKVKTGRVFKEEFGFRGISPGIRSRFSEKGFSDESLMLTGDLNVIEVKWIVQYKIRDPRLWLFAVRDPVAAIRDLSESVMRQIVGNRLSDQVLTLQRVEIAAKAQKELQTLLDSYKTGVQIVTVKLQDVNPPPPVQPAFNEVNEARQQKERMINEAQEAYNREVPKALGEASRVVTEAEGYSTEKVNRAQGEAKRFEDVLAGYLTAKDVTRRRLYLEAMQRMIKNAEKIYVLDEKVRGMLPLLNLSPKAAQAQDKGVK
ncbi:MAG: FtsH protease activity modulator HflK [Desulfarculus sp.]|nr:FtsH protease activity modulator HflK [Pseudomonadota bacterium]MBV1714483.1 FtsH protease activity modulator HflK [Desulfarculus sp.]MBU4574758.1 FtsH protease activity modulator HflK [Pseudomonadota bacterium]MBU4599819.1 FtsH protease activity modulator HflK [Pseudomonadota bacterium]MBV1737104.1 FtsH protease activity modulator HflK [Desulfarculus sp.]